MLHEVIDKKIQEATMSSSKFELECLRLIKAEFLKYNASKEAVGKPMNDAVEVSILKKMAKQRKESAELYQRGGRAELAEKELAEAEFIEQFLPAPVSREDIEKAVNQFIFDGIMPVKKNMGQLIKAVKAKYPAADGKTVSEIVSNKLS
jgi:uncharacterized protein YqeY